MLLNAGPFRPPSARACAVLLLPLLALPLGCSSDEGSSSDTIEAPSTTAAPVDEVGDEDADADADALQQAVFSENVRPEHRASRGTLGAATRQMRDSDCPIYTPKPARVNARAGALRVALSTPV